MWGIGPANPIGLLVGESPGREEAEAGRPFIGPTGRQLDQELLEVGLDRSKLFIMNAVLCCPPDGKTARKLGAAIKCCAPAFAFQRAKLPKNLPTFGMGRGAAIALGFTNVSLEKGRGFIR